MPFMHGIVKRGRARRTASVNAYEIGNYVPSGTPGNNEVQHLVIPGPVTQRLA